MVDACGLCGLGRDQLGEWPLRRCLLHTHPHLVPQGVLRLFTPNLVTGLSRSWTPAKYLWNMVSLCVPLPFLVWLPPLSLSQLAPPHTLSFLVFNLTNIGGKGRQTVR